MGSVYGELAFTYKCADERATIILDNRFFGVDPDAILRRCEMMTPDLGDWRTRVLVVAERLRYDLIFVAAGHSNIQVLIHQRTGGGVNHTCEEVWHEIRAGFAGHRPRLRTAAIVDVEQLSPVMQAHLGFSFTYHRELLLYLVIAIAGGVCVAINAAGVVAELPALAGGTFATVWVAFTVFRRRLDWRAPS
jgi:hypothetical protein